MQFNKRPKYRVRPNIRFKNKLNGELVMGDLINEEEIEGKQFYVIRNTRGSVVKLTREAYYIQK